MSVKRDSFIKYVDSFLLGKITDEHLVSKINFDTEKIKVTFQPPIATHFKVTTTFKHPLIEGKEGYFIFNNTDNLRRSLSTMEEDITFNVEDNMEGVPRYIHMKDSKKNISLLASANYEQVNDVPNIPPADIVCKLSDEFISSYSKLVSIFKPSTVRIANSDDDTYNVLKFNGNNLSGDVELRLDCDFVDVDRPRKDNRMDAYDAMYLLKVLEQGKSISGEVIMYYPIAFTTNEIPLSALFFEFDNEDMHTRYLIRPTIKQT